MYPIHSVVTYKQVCYQLSALIFDLQKYSYMVWLQPVAILKVLQCLVTYTVLLRDLSIVNGKIRVQYCHCIVK